MRLPRKGKFPTLEKNRFLVPTKVSLTEKGKAQWHGTDAFVPVGTELPKGLSPHEKQNLLRQHAHQAPFFVKKLTPRQRIIAEKLEAVGIKTEKVILILKNGRAVFEKAGHSLDSEQGKALFQRNFWENTKTLETMVAKMHSLGITHNHLHAGNITIDEKGIIRIIDLGKATIVDFKKLKCLPKGWIFKKFFYDLQGVSGILTVMGVREAYVGFTDDAFTTIVTRYSRELLEKIPQGDRQILWGGYHKAKEHVREHLTKR